MKASPMARPPMAVEDIGLRIDEIDGLLSHFHDSSGTGSEAHGVLGGRHGSTVDTGTPPAHMDVRRILSDKEASDDARPTARRESP